jgi:uracil-DNA glycosylase family 4
MSKISEMKIIEDEILNLKKSPLYKYRIENNYVPVIGQGNLDAQVVFIGEAPGKNEAKSGKPFCGASGKILDELLESIKINREDVYITNVVKDRPEDNRDPKPAEIELYSPFLFRQLEIIKPKVIATLGRFSMEYIMKKFDLGNNLGSKSGLTSKISKLHGKKFKTQTSWGEVEIVPLYHPAVAVYNRNKLDELKKDFAVLV